MFKVKQYYLAALSEKKIFFNKKTEELLRINKEKLAKLIYIKDN